MEFVKSPFTSGELLTQKKIERWIFVLALVNAGLVALIMIVGAITRLTDSGLSITEWQVFRGIIPPLTHQTWQEAFALYQQSSEFRLQNVSMTLEEFKSIYRWEYIHRLLGRLFVFTYVLPLGVIIVRGHRAGLKVPLIGTLLVILFLGALQGFLGWWMVKSGLLQDRIDVSPLRLMIHLAMAWIIYAGFVWCAMSMRQTSESLRSIISRNVSSLRIFALTSLTLLFITMLLGALTAGTKAGFSHFSWPLFENGSLVPEGYTFSLNSPVSIQATHRILAYILTLWILIGSIYIAATTTWYLPMAILITTVLVQALLGVLVLLKAVPLPLAVLHQSGALLLWTVFLCLYCLTSFHQPKRNQTKRNQPSIRQQTS